jgi:hypothetical protein
MCDLRVVRDQARAVCRFGQVLTVCYSTPVVALITSSSQCSLVNDAVFPVRLSIREIQMSEITKVLLMGTGRLLERSYVASFAFLLRGGESVCRSFAEDM